MCFFAKVSAQTNYSNEFVSLETIIDYNDHTKTWQNSTSHIYLFTKLHPQFLDISFRLFKAEIWLARDDPVQYIVTGLKNEQSLILSLCDSFFTVSHVHTSIHVLNKMNFGSSLILTRVVLFFKQQSKLEKADILEMTVKHLQNIQSNKVTGERQTGTLILHWALLHFSAPDVKRKTETENPLHSSKHPYCFIKTQNSKLLHFPGNPLWICMPEADWLLYLMM